MPAPQIIRNLNVGGQRSIRLRHRGGKRNAFQIPPTRAHAVTSGSHKKQSNFCVGREPSSSQICLGQNWPGSGSQSRNVGRRRFGAHARPWRMTVKARDAFTIGPLETIRRWPTVLGHVEDETKFLFVVQVGVDIILWGLLRVEIGARGSGGAVVELNNMLSGWARGTNLKHSGPISRHTRYFTGVLVVVAQRPKMVESAPAPSFSGKRYSGSPRAVGGINCSAAHDAEAAAAHVPSIHHGIDIVHFAEILRRSKDRIHSPLGIDQCAAQAKAFLIVLALMVLDVVR